LFKAARVIGFSSGQLLVLDVVVGLATYRDQLVGFKTVFQTIMAQFLFRKVRLCRGGSGGAAAPLDFEK
jgi:hypothetical protein